MGQPGSAKLPEGLTSTDGGAINAAVDAPPPPPWPGPYFIATRSSAGVYSEAGKSKKTKVGYMRSGGKVPVKAETVEGKGCSKGWFEIVGGGFVCSNYGTTKLDSAKARFTVKQPNWDETLPYKYARNSKNGTPLYKSVPTPAQMKHYESDPKKEAEKKKAESDKKKKAESDKTQPSKSAGADDKKAAARSATAREGSSKDKAPVGSPEKSENTAEPAAASDTPTPLPAGSTAPDAPDAGTVKWWNDPDAEINMLTMRDLAAGADDVLAKRMVKGFYIAIDKTFNWNKRTWYKSTKGLVAPSNRFWVTNASEFHGVVLSEQTQLPLAWVYGWKKHRPTYDIDEETKQIKPLGKLAHFDSVPLTGKTIEIGKKKYVETTEGGWVRSLHLRVTGPGPVPADLLPGERWIDVNLSTQTIVAFVGTKPVWASLISSGKESKIKEKDHRTPRGEWRVRTKHVTTTMDGNGSLAGDMPYSIEDVPYVQYFYRAYALHAAFWHRNYGVRMSHGCINLSPLDAKYLFRFTGPHVPDGWHGSWSKEERPGSRIVVHD